MDKEAVIDLSIADKVDRLWAERDIRNLALRYAYAVDSRDWPLMESLWVKTEAPAEGLLDFHLMRNMPVMFKDAGVSTLLVANHLIEFDGPDRAFGTVYCHCHAENGVFFEQLICYKDVYERQDGWKFRTRDHLLWWGKEHVSPMKQAPAQWPASQVGAGTALTMIRKAE